MKKPLVLIIALCLVCTACDPIERQAYKAVVGAKAFLDSVKQAHPECPSAQSGLCTALDRATGAKDALIDAGIAYCSGPSFESGGACEPPKKGTPGLDQAAAKLKAALENYEQTEADVKKAVGK